MTETQTDVVTGAFSFTGQYIADRLLADGRRVTTLTNHPNRTTSFSDEVHVEPYRFDDPDALAANLEGGGDGHPVQHVLDSRPTGRAAIRQCRQVQQPPHPCRRGR